MTNKFNFPVNDAMVVRKRGHRRFTVEQEGMKMSGKDELTVVVNRKFVEVNEFF